MRVESKDLPIYREEQHQVQEGKCGLCKFPVDIEEAVVDHDHTTGKIRRILHRGCNAFEGKCLSAYKRYIGKSKGLHFPDLLIELSKYLDADYSNNPLHPSVLTENEKELKLITKKLKGGIKRESTILDYELRQKELRKIIKTERKENSW